VNNYTRDYKFIWDEIELPVTYNSDWGLAIEKVLAIAKRETASETKGAEMDMERLSKKYFFEKRIASPVIYLRFTDNWIDLRLRYVIDARNRRITRSRISTMILEEIQRSGKIKIASQTTAIVEFPEVTVKQARP
jgi:small-conductance mechanosensitive channel